MKRSYIIESGVTYQVSRTDYGEMQIAKITQPYAILLEAGTKEELDELTQTMLSTLARHRSEINSIAKP